MEIMGGLFDPASVNAEDIKTVSVPSGTAIRPSPRSGISLLSRPAAGVPSARSEAPFRVPFRFDFAISIPGAQFLRLSWPRRMASTADATSE